MMSIMNPNDKEVILLIPVFLFLPVILRYLHLKKKKHTQLQKKMFSVPVFLPL